MKSNYRRLGDCIRPVDNRNRDLSVTKIFGVNLSKKFMPSIANTKEVDLSNYKIVKKGQFGCKLMSVGRDNRLPIGFLREEGPVIISPAYYVFEVIDEKILLPEYLFIWLSRNENDRRLGFISAGDIRGGISWDEFCEILIPIPEDIDKQRNCVYIYNGLLNNQQCYERSLDGLHFICDSYMETLALKEGTKVLGDYIRPIDNRNIDLKINHLRGVSTAKELIKSVANTNDLDFSTYKIVEKGQFVYVSDTSRRGDKIALAMNEKEPCIVSSIYTVFETIKNKGLMPEFLFLWFKRKEFDRYARFHSWGSARETFDWADMCEVKIPIPDIEVQKSIVAIHHTLETRKRINEKLKSMIAPLCPVLIKGVVDSINSKSK